VLKEKYEHSKDECEKWEHKYNSVHEELDELQQELLKLKMKLKATQKECDDWEEKYKNL
jgi:peptidoglycan hydrolase CwlO-like protein